MEQNRNLEEDERTTQLNLSTKMQEAIKLLEQEEFYLYDYNKHSVWKAYGTSKTIHTRTMKALEKRGIVNVQYAISGDADKMAVLSKKTQLN